MFAAFKRHKNKNHFPCCLYKKIKPQQQKDHRQLCRNKMTPLILKISLLRIFTQLFRNLVTEVPAKIHFKHIPQESFSQSKS